MDTLGALALATEPPTDHLMDRDPVGRRYDLSLSMYEVRVISICLPIYVSISCLQRTSHHKYHVEKLVCTSKLTSFSSFHHLFKDHVYLTPLSAAPIVFAYD